MSSVPRRLTLPPEDRIRSPHSGWTRAHWEGTADHLLDAVEPYLSPQGASLRLPGPPSWSGPQIDGLEGFARSFLLAAIRLAGAGGADPRNRTERWARGLAAGTHPGGPETWPDITDHSQQIVEAAAIALALHLSRPWLWDRLAPAVRDRTAHWLGGIVGRRTRDNNHVLFQVVVEEFLHTIGALHDRTGIDAGLDRVEQWYRGEGWYQDGPRHRSDYRDPTDGSIRARPYDAGKRFDYYNAWGFHLYTLLWARMAGPHGSERAATYRSRLRSFLTQYPHFFGADGAPVHHGRSLSYRLACLAPLWLGALEDATPHAPGLTRRWASATLRHFAGHGVPDERGLLTLGWYHGFRSSAQAYSGPGAPYAAAKGFLGLVLPPHHPVWTDPEQPLPAETDDRTAALPVPGFLTHSTRDDGLVRLLNHGSHYLSAPPAHHRDDPYYAKLAYSNRTGPQVGAVAQEQRLDNHIALISPAGDTSRREGIHRIAVTDTYAASWHRPQLDAGALPDTCRIDTVSLVCGRWEVRVHRVNAPPGHRLREGGYALAAAARPLAHTSQAQAAVRRTDGLVSAVVGLHGWTAAHVHHAYAANAFGAHSVVPYLSGITGPAQESIYVSAILLSGSHPGPLEQALPHDITITVTTDALGVHLRAPGRPRSLISPGAWPPVVEDVTTAPRPQSHH
ncbi:hypothetical protein SALBM135S_05654 [Streptomyces alboniger]